MGVLKDLGTSTVHHIDKVTGYPADEYNHLLDPLNPRDGMPVERWNRKGTELYNLTSPYGHLAFAIGSSDDFICFDGKEINAGPLGSFYILHAVANSETHHFIEGFEYTVMPCNSLEQKAAVILAADELTGRAIEWCATSGIRHSRKGWNQAPRHFLNDVARDLFEWRFRDIPYHYFREDRIKVQKIVAKILEETT